MKAWLSRLALVMAPGLTDTGRRGPFGFPKGFRMRRRTVLYSMLAATFLSGPAMAQGPGDQIAAQLKRMGYAEVTVSRTLLGRMRIVGTSSRYRREIVLDPRNGEILRDLRRPLDGSSVVIAIGNDDGASHSAAGGSGSGGTGSGTDDDDDDDDDQDDDDSSDDD
jgi:hypothetical protein